MARELMLLVATAIVCVAPGIRGQAHLSFAVDSKVNEISRTGCGETKLCIASPAECDPMDGHCMFTSITINKSTSSSLDVALAGQSTGFIAVGFTRKPSEPVVLFVCAQNSADNGAFFFFSMMSDSEGTLTPVRMNVNEIRGSVDGDMIKCEFNVPRMEDEKMDNNVHVILGSGTAEGKRLGTFITALDSGLLDVSDPTAA